MLGMLASAGPPVEVRAVHDAAVGEREGPRDVGAAVKAQVVLELVGQRRHGAPVAPWHVAQGRQVGVGRELCPDGFVAGASRVVAEPGGQFKVVPCSVAPVGELPPGYLELDITRRDPLPSWGKPQGGAC